MSDTITLAVSGDVSLGDLAVATSRFHRLVEALTTENAPSAEIRWDIDDLQRGSVITTVRGRGDHAQVERVVDAYMDVGRALEAGRRIAHSDPVVEAAEQLVRIIDGEIDSIRFETAEADAVIIGPPLATQLTLPPVRGMRELPRSSS